MASAPARLNAEQALHQRPSSSSQPLAARRLQHRVLAADLVDEGRHREASLHPAHDVQVGHAGLDHHHVGAFLEVERHFAQRLVAVGRVHLVGPSCRPCRGAGRADGVAERAVEGGRVLGGVGHDPRVGAPARRARRGSRRCGRPSCRTAPRCRRRPRPGTAPARTSTSTVSSLRMTPSREQAVLAVAGVRVERDVGDHAQLGELLFSARMARHTGCRGSVASRPSSRLQLRRRHRKQRHRRDAQLDRLSATGQQQVDRQPLDAGHRCDRLAPVLAVQHEHRQDQVVGRQPVLGHQPAGPGIGAVAAGPHAQIELPRTCGRPGPVRPGVREK